MPAAYTWKELSQQHHEAKSLAVFPQMQGSFGDKIVSRGGDENLNYRLAW